MFWTLFKKDFLRLRLYLGAFACLTAIQAAGSLRWVTDSYWLFKWISQFGEILEGGCFLLPFVIIPMLIQDDALVGCTAFHFTRPISRLALLAEKVFFTAVFLILLPVGLDVLVLLEQGLSCSSSMLVGLQLLYDNTGYIFYFVILASLTRNIRQYLISAIVCSAILFLAQGFLYVHRYELMFLKNPLLIDGRDYSLAWSLQGLVVLFMIVFVLFLLHQQFQKRNTRKTVAWIIIFFIFLEILKRFWSWDFLRLNDLKLPRMDVGQRIEVNIDTDDFYIRESPSAWTKNNQYYRISASETLRGLGPRQFAKAVQIRYPQIDYPDGKIIKEGGDWGAPPRVLIQNQSSVIDHRSFVPALLNIYDEETVICPFTVGLSDSWIKLTWMAFKDYDQSKDVPALYRAQELFDVYEFRITGTIPFKAGQEGRVDTQTFRIYDAIEQKEGVRLIIEEKRVNRAMGLRNTSEMNNFPEHFNYGGKKLRVDEAIYALRNVKTREVVLPDVSVDYYEQAESLNGAFFCRYFGLRYSHGGKKFGALPRLDQQWLKDAELVRIDAVRVGYFMKNVQYAGVKFGRRKNENDLKDGVRRYYYSTGELRSEQLNVSANQPVFLREFYKNGALASEWAFQAGVQSGVRREFYEDGGLMYESEYKEGKLNGRVRKYSSDGKIISERFFRNGLEENN